jgi:hypothetical protein
MEAQTELAMEAQTCLSADAAGTLSKSEFAGLSAGWISPRI